MVNCDNCGKKIGAFEPRFYVKKEGSKICCCDKCNEKVESEIQRKEIKEKADKKRNFSSKYSLWEYKSISVKISFAFSSIDNKMDSKTDSLLNELGSEGWELVSCAPLNVQGTTGHGSKTTKYIYTFKRKL